MQYSVSENFRSLTCAKYIVRCKYIVSIYYYYTVCVTILKSRTNCPPYRIIMHRNDSVTETWCSCDYTGEHCRKVHAHRPKYNNVIGIAFVEIKRTIGTVPGVGWTSLASVNTGKRLVRGCEFRKYIII